MKSLILSLIIFIASFSNAYSNNYETKLLFFWGNGCPHCNDAKPFLKDLEEKYPTLKIDAFETWNNQENAEKFKEIANNYNVTASGVPAFFISDFKPLFGFSKNAETILSSLVDYCVKNGCKNPYEVNLNNKETIEKIETDEELEEDLKFELPIIGMVDLSNAPLILTTSIIAFVDGFNPCSTWLIMFLLAMVIHTKSRKKVLLVSLTFLIITASTYGIFMIGVLNVFSYVGYLEWIQITVAIIALLFAMVNIKDYFWFKKGISFTISDDHKPTIFERMRNVMNPNHSTLTMIGATVILAFGVVLVELPCTAGFPVIWANLLAKNNVHGTYFVSLFTIYLIIYLLDEIALILAAVITLKASRFEEKHGRILKLIGGMIMAFLALFMLFSPETLNSFKGSMLIFGLASLSCALIIFVDKKILPKFRK